MERTGSERIVLRCDERDVIRARRNSIVAIVAGRRGRRRRELCAKRNFLRAGITFHGEEMANYLAWKGSNACLNNLFITLK